MFSTLRLKKKSCLASIWFNYKAHNGSTKPYYMQSCYDRESSENNSEIKMVQINPRKILQQ